MALFSLGWLALIKSVSSVVRLELRRGSTESPQGNVMVDNVIVQINLYIEEVL